MNKLILSNEIVLTKVNITEFILPNEIVLTKVNITEFILPNELHEYIKKYSSCRTIRILHSLNKELSNKYNYTFGNLNKYKYFKYNIKYGFIRNAPKNIYKDGILINQIVYTESNKYLVILNRNPRESFSSWSSNDYFKKVYQKLYVLTYLPLILLRIRYNSNCIHFNKDRHQNEDNYLLKYFKDSGDYDMYLNKLGKRLFKPLCKIIIDDLFNDTICQDKKYEPIPNFYIENIVSGYLDNGNDIDFESIIKKYNTNEYISNSEGKVLHLSENDNINEAIVVSAYINLSLKWMHIKKCDKKVMFVSTAYSHAERILPQSELFTFSHNSYE